jgi:hypothetical protein
MPSSYTIFLSFIKNHKVLSIITLISLITFGMTIYSVYQINKLLTPTIDRQLHLAGDSPNALDVNSVNYTNIYRFDTGNYKFDSFTNFSGHFRVLIYSQYGGSFSQMKFRVVDDKGRDITSSDVVVPQSNMVINFKTVEYTRYLDLQLKSSQKDIILDSLSIYAKGSLVKGFL